MTTRDHLLCLVAATALVAFSGISRADEDPTSDPNGFARSEIQAEPMTCAQARAHAWFLRQLELGEPNSYSMVDEPAECRATYVAAAPEGDAEVTK